MVEPRKKKSEESTPVHITEVDKSVADKAEAIATRAWKKEILVLITTAVLSLASTAAAVATVWMQSKTRDAVIEGTASVDIHNTRHGAKLDKVVITSKQNHDLSNSLMLAMKKSLMDTAVLVAEMSSDPLSAHHADHSAHLAKAKLYEEAYLAHKKTHDEMQTRDKDER